MDERPRSLEGVGMSVWRGRTVLVTGHTGFKGAWLAAWLQALGARVAGLSLPPPTDPSLFALLSPWPELEHHEADIRDPAATTRAVARSGAEVLFHLAAQPVVAEAYRDPRTTFASNVMGTVNLLQAALDSPAVRAVLVVTTDKVYVNHEGGDAFGEDSPLGAHEPYGASKAAAEMVVQGFQPAFRARGIALATARAGNVIGGGDWAAHRIVPDLLRAMDGAVPASLRHPGAIRPWQHVLDPLAGYLRHAEHLFERPRKAPDALNFGPDEADARTVGELADRLVAGLPGHPGWRADGAPIAPESTVLRLSSDRARRTLGWTPRLTFAQAVDWTADWYAGWRAGVPARRLCLAQIDRFGAVP